MTTEVFPDPAAVAELERSFGGQIVRPEDQMYDEQRRVWNGAISRFPALIARCAGVADVIAAVRFARASGLEVAVRSGGHSFAGLSLCEGGLVVDLSLMKGVRIDPVRRKARAQAGVLLGDLDRETQAFGLAVPAGTVTHTGVAGLTLGGGIGWLTRKYGLTIDQLVGVDVVTAEGGLVRASESENPDLFWGIRGGGGNFGIVTEFEFRLNPLGPIVLAGPIYWPMSESPRLLRFYREWIEDAPDELATIVLHRRAPALPIVPLDLRGKPVVLVACCYAGDVERGERVIRPLRRFGSPVLDLCVAKPFVQHQAMFDTTSPHGWWYYVRSCDVAELSDDVIDITAEHAMRMRSPASTFPIFHLGGAAARVSHDATAYNGRQARFTFAMSATTVTSDGFDDERTWARGLWSALQPSCTGVSTNFLMDEGEQRVRQAYGAEKFDRLRALKRRYDPANVFRHNQNVPPG